MKVPSVSALLSAMILCGVGIVFSPLAQGADATPQASPAGQTSAAVPIPPQPELHPSVRAVGVRTKDGEQRNVNVIQAQRGDQIWVDIYNFKIWVDSLGEKRPQNHEIKDLVLYLDHIPLLGVSPTYWYETKHWTAGGKDEKWPSVEYTVTTVGFSLVRNESSKAAWANLLNKPVLKRKVVVSVGFSNGMEIHSELTPDDTHTGKPDQHFYLLIIPRIRTALGVIVILSSLIAFLVMARHTDIIRDATVPRRPDGQRPYSLARGQMAFWFFLVIASFFFLWIVTGDMDTLNTSVLALIGISAGTALGAAFVDAGKPASADPSDNQPPVDVTRPRSEVLAELEKLQLQVQNELEALQKSRADIASSDTEALNENERRQNELRGRLSDYRWQSAYFAWPKWKGVMYDLLAENNLISFHRFQIFVWTLVLGIMFVANVYNELAMPEFSATLLGLLGISAGTYVGFKLPESKQA
jgi:hypothetical protein